MKMGAQTGSSEYISTHAITLFCGVHHGQTVSPALATGLGFWNDCKDAGSTLVTIQNNLEIYTRTVHY